MEERTFGVDTVEYRDAWLKNLQGKDLTVEERGALTSAASVIPTQTVNKIYGKLEEDPLYAKLNASHIPGYLTVPKATTINDAAWTAIGADSTDSSDAIGSVSLGLKKLVKTIEITADIQAASIGAFETWLVDRLSQKMQRAICAAVINGDTAASVPEPQGILKAVSAGTFSKNSIAELSGMMGGVGSAYQAGAVWIMAAADFYAKIVPLATDSNGLLVNDGIRQRLLGHEVVFCDAVAGSVIYGNLTEGYLFNFGKDIEISADTSVAFRSGSTVYRAMALCDGAVVDADAFAANTLA